jgi:hypothetical protein
MTSGFRNYQSGDAVTMPTNGRPFQLICTDCGMVHSLIHTVDDDGNIKMQVYPHQLEDAADSRHFVTDAGGPGGTSQRRTATMSPTPQRHRYDDEEAYGPDGLLKDGHAITIPLLEMRDAQRSSAPPVLSITTGLGIGRPSRRGPRPWSS